MTELEIKTQFELWKEFDEALKAFKEELCFFKTDAVYLCEIIEKKEDGSG